MTNQTTTTFDEAPCSWNTRYISPEGFSCQITLRGETGSDVLTRAQAAISWLLEKGCQPNSNGTYETKEFKHQDKDTNQNQNPGWCPIHQTEMKRWEKNGRVWFSHKVNGEWCSGK